ncbi:hypothetical protein OB2597_05380 [Pseudooceanicola batsensis HTCC2597]|uniref:Uncharacterized protein n=1 Tax=Pseudooceanicola batsensis (strain ATCC BAA-863 / DSM 15984 / KCTC 12145 / HTCC2597) TaxID=252305 RepID=A3TSR1_PSEBH|nr:hypothetical protein OB2597_05380 [Pseudooceanicola batsensis HTCC2597]
MATLRLPFPEFGHDGIDDLVGGRFGQEERAAFEVVISLSAPADSSTALRSSTPIMTVSRVARSIRLIASSTVESSMRTMLDTPTAMVHKGRPRWTVLQSGLEA